MAALHNLEREMQSENVVMRDLAERSSRESTSVRILTIIMLSEFFANVSSLNTLGTND